MAMSVVLVRLALHLAFTNFQLESALQNLKDGMWLALIILAFGAVNVLVDFRKLLQRRQSSRPIVQAVTLSLALIPELLETLERIKFAVSLRAKRKGLALVRAILSPLLAASVDRAIELTNTMATRQRAGHKRLDRVSIHNGSIGYREGEDILHDVSLELASGELLMITGATGSGKSSLLKLIQSKYPSAALVTQIPRDSFLSETVRGELNYRNSPSKLETFDLVEILDRNPRTLSAGWQQRVAIAAAISAGSNLLLLDEPFSALDDQGARALQLLLAKLKQQGKLVVVAEHRSELLQGLANTELQIIDGNVVTGVFTKNQYFEVRKIRPKVTVIHGENGSGKTTHLKSLAGLGAVLVPQPASDLLFMNSVAEELKQANKDADVAPGTAEELFAKFAPAVKLGENPQDLSTGQKLALALAIQLVKQKRTMLLDEPTLGFDEDAKAMLVEIIAELPNDLEVIIATHDEHLGQALQARELRMSGGVPVEK
jgi:energy-coupling factor transport system ATP-binding protein